MAFRRPQRAPQQVDFADILADDERDAPCPTLYELEEMLQALSKFDPINVRLTRTQLRWTAKAASKNLGINYHHPFK